ncbi:hypothetical protein [Puia sp.]|uniref:hypothetical protein n=1 Tax=Puia sp. TaxID=2045100 RepID=UPI002F418B3A
MNDWTGEEYFCNATRALQYVALQDQRFKVSETLKVPVRNIYKRFFSDGNFVNKIELGLRDDDPYLYGDAEENPYRELKAFLKHLLQLPVRVAGQPIELFKSGTALTNLYQQATTPHISAKHELPGLVQEGEPCLLAILQRDEAYYMPGEAKLIDTFPLDKEGAPIELYGYTLHLQNDYIKCWIIRIPHEGYLKGTPANAMLRKLRINLMRVHAEKETIKGLLNAVQQKRLDIDGPDTNISLLSEYLKDTSEKLFKPRRAGIDQESILDFALRSETEVLPGDTLAILVKKLNDKFLAKTMQKFVAQSKPADKKVLLFLCSSPGDKNPLDFGEEFKTIQDLHDSSIDRASFQIEIRTAVEKGRVKELLVKYKPDILHISLHASPINGLYFQDKDKNSSPMNVQEWKNIIELLNDIHRPSVIILSACNSYEHAVASKPFSDFSAGTTMVFPDLAGITYARGFYTILFNDENISWDICHRSGIQEVKDRTPPFDPINGTNVQDIIRKC